MALGIIRIGSICSNIIWKDKTSRIIKSLYFIHVCEEPTGSQLALRYKDSNAHVAKHIEAPVSLKNCFRPVSNLIGMDEVPSWNTVSFIPLWVTLVRSLLCLFDGTLLHFLACYCHQQISGLVWNCLLECASLHSNAHVRAWVFSCACMRREQNKNPLIKTLLHSATSSQKLQSVSLNQQSVILHMLLSLNYCIYTVWKMEEHLASYFLRFVVVGIWWCSRVKCRWPCKCHWMHGQAGHNDQH